MLFICYSKCSTCNKAKRFLDDHGASYELRDIKTQNPTADELRDWQARSGLPLKKFFNTSGQLYRSMKIKDRLPSMSDEEIIELLATDGMLVKRPILVKDDQVLVGFREAAYQELLDQA